MIDTYETKENPVKSRRTKLTLEVSAAAERLSGTVLREVWGEIPLTYSTFI
jgi:hypothetical protein